MHSISCPTAYFHAEPAPGYDVIKAPTDQRGEGVDAEFAEIFLTADKRSERAQDAPVSLTVIDASSRDVNKVAVEDANKVAVEGVNKVAMEGGQLLALWKPAQFVSLELGALH